jgi:Outer membrane protein beta-barrel domain
MKKIALLSLTAAIFLLGQARGLAQSETPKLEAGVQLTSLSLSQQDYFGNNTEPGFGGRITYNFTNKLAAEAEINFYPNHNVFRAVGEGRALQGQFGIKVGKRFKKFGIFVKARPGFLSIGKVFSYEPGSTADISGFVIRDAHIGRKTHLTMDVGSVLELYPSRRTVVRFDAGDTIVRYGRSFEPLDFSNQLGSRPAFITHNFQLTAGVALRFQGSGHEDVDSAPMQRKGAPKYEAGVQFTSLSFNLPRPLCLGLCVYPTDRGPVTEPGLGGRFTYNLTSYIGLEAEGNFFVRDTPEFDGPGGHIFQGQFGVKAGKRFDSFGFFGKLRPGFVGFTRVNQLVSTETVILPAFDNRQVTFGTFRVGRQLYYSTDVGGVIEFYPSRRVMTRFDFGDTIIRYSEYAVQGFSVSHPIVRRPPETRHNFQFTAGLGFRF